MSLKERIDEILSECIAKYSERNGNRSWKRMVTSSATKSLHIINNNQGKLYFSPVNPEIGGGNLKMQFSFAFSNGDLKGYVEQYIASISQAIVFIREAGYKKSRLSQLLGQSILKAVKAYYIALQEKELKDANMLYEKLVNTANQHTADNRNKLESFTRHLGDLQTELNNYIGTIKDDDKILLNMNSKLDTCITGFSAFIQSTTNQMEKSKQDIIDLMHRGIESSFDYHQGVVMLAVHNACISSGEGVQKTDLYHQMIYICFNALINTFRRDIEKHEGSFSCDEEIKLLVDDKAVREALEEIIKEAGNILTPTFQKESVIGEFDKEKGSLNESVNENEHQLIDEFISFSHQQSRALEAYYEEAKTFLSKLSELSNSFSLNISQGALTQDVFKLSLLSLVLSWNEVAGVINSVLENLPKGRTLPKESILSLLSFSQDAKEGYYLRSQLTIDERALREIKQKAETDFKGAVEKAAQNFTDQYDKMIKKLETIQSSFVEIHRLKLMNTNYFDDIKQQIESLQNEYKNTVSLIDKEAEVIQENNQNIHQLAREMDKLEQGRMIELRSAAPSLNESMQNAQVALFNSLYGTLIESEMITKISYRHSRKRILHVIKLIATFEHLMRYANVSDLDLPREIAPLNLSDKKQDLTNAIFFQQLYCYSLRSHQKSIIKNTSLELYEQFKNTSYFDFLMSFFTVQQNFMLLVKEDQKKYFQVLDSHQRVYKTMLLTLQKLMSEQGYFKDMKANYHHAQNTAIQNMPLGQLERTKNKTLFGHVKRFFRVVSNNVTVRDYVPKQEHTAAFSQKLKEAMGDSVYNNVGYDWLCLLDTSKERIQKQAAVDKTKLLLIGGVSGVVTRLVSGSSAQGLLGAAIGSGVYSISSTLSAVMYNNISRHSAIQHELQARQEHLQAQYNTAQNMGRIREEVL